VDDAVIGTLEITYEQIGIVLRVLDDQRAKSLAHE